MPVLAEYLAGDTSAFAFKVGFHRDPDEGRGADEDTAASWGAFQLWAGGRNLCLHTEQSELVDSVHWYLLPLLEWLAGNWDPIFHEEKLPIKVAGDGAWQSLRRTRFPPSAIEQDEAACSQYEESWQQWWRRHSLRACREGGLFPDIVIRRSHDDVEVSWGPAPLAGTSNESCAFLFSDGRSTASAEAAATAVYRVLDQAAEYLLRLRPASSRLRRLRKAVHAIQSGSQEQRVSWMAGLGSTHRMALQRWNRIRRRVDAVARKKSAVNAGFESDLAPLIVRGSCHAALMFGSTSPHIGDADAMTLAMSLVEAYDTAGDPAELRPHLRHVPPTGIPDIPWQEGYDLAVAALESLSVSFDEGFVDIESILGSSGIVVRQARLNDAGVRGVALAGPKHRPTIIVNTNHAANGYRSGYRFTLAHELCHLLHDRSVGVRLAIVSGDWAPRNVERRANAFAAMFLMPHQLVARAIAALAEPPGTVSGVLAVANALQTSVRAALPHLANLGFIDSETRSTIESELEHTAIARLES